MLSLSIDIIQHVVLDAGWYDHQTRALASGSRETASIDAGVFGTVPGTDELVSFALKRAIELEPESAALIFREAVRSGPPGIPAVIFRGYRSLFVLPYLNVTANASLEEFEREVLAHPVFLLQSVM